MLREVFLTSHICGSLLPTVSSAGKQTTVVLSPNHGQLHIYHKKERFSTAAAAAAATHGPMIYTLITSEEIAALDQQGLAKQPTAALVYFVSDFI